MSDAGSENLQGWVQTLGNPASLKELAALVACALMAWLVTRVFARAFDGRNAKSIMFGERHVDGVLFPALLLTLAYVARTVLATDHHSPVFRVAIPVLVSLLAIRLGVKVLQATFQDSPSVRMMERTISWIAWLVMVLWVSDLLPLILEELDQIHWKVGTTTLSVRMLIEGSLTAGFVLIFALWISSAIESQLLRDATGGELSLRKAFSNATRAVLTFVGLMLALSAVGIDLTALSVLGGAVGVGIGLGLQKLAANYVSGFVILAERSMRIGDSVQVDNFNGVITQINARYTVIRSLAGRESIVPNEMLITNRVENLSLADPKVWQSTNVQVGYDSDVELVTQLLLQAATDEARVLTDPAPVVFLMAFAADGLDFRLGYWIGDPDKGSDNLRSSINKSILRLLREHAVEIPFPQRVIHQR